MSLQIYFFSSILLVLVGVFLSFDKFGASLKTDMIFLKAFIEHKIIGLVLGIGLMFFSLLQLLSRGVGGDVAVIGNIIPALLGLVGGGTLIITCVNKRYEGENKYIQFGQDFVQANVAIIGVLMIIIGIIHAVFPTVMLL